MLENQLLANGLHSSLVTHDIPSQLEAVRAQRDRIKDAIHRKKAALGVDSRTHLEAISGSEYLRLRMNARALKQRIRDRLRQRKFELERLERAYRQTVNGTSEGCYILCGADNSAQKRICVHILVLLPSGESLELSNWPRIITTFAANLPS